MIQMVRWLYHLRRVLAEDKEARVKLRLQCTLGCRFSRLGECKVDVPYPPPPLEMYPDSGFTFSIFADVINNG